MLSPLPIDEVLPELLRQLRESSSVLLRSPTGAGKTTRVPPALLNQSWLSPNRVVMLEPRRVAARAAARRIAEEANTSLGEYAGYHVRFERRAQDDTQVLCVTPGVFLRMLLDDPSLAAIGAVIFDEFHERGLETDLALGMVRLVQGTLRPELRLVVMSATLQTEPLRTYLDGCPVVESEGRLFPVQVIYAPAEEQQSLVESVARGIRQAATLTDGDLLAFLPGVGEIRGVLAELRDWAAARDIRLLPLYGELPAEEQDAALRSYPQRKVVVATNVAESSVTVERVTGVVDSGLVRELRFDPSVGLDRLELRPISRSAADQRLGRAGRVAPGICIRLWSESAQRGRPEQPTPEIHRVDLAGAVLQLLALGETDMRNFPWPEAPAPQHVESAWRLLERLGAIEGGRLSRLGEEMARLPFHPRLSRLVLTGRDFGCPEAAALTAALLAERDPFPRRERPSQPTSSDLLDRVHALLEYEESRRLDSHLGRLNPAAAQWILRSRDQLLRLLNIRHLGRDSGSFDTGLLQAIFQAFPDRLARRRSPGSPRGVMADGRGVRLAEASGVVDAELFVCVEADGGTAETLVRQASAVDRDWLPASQVQVKTEVAFDPVTERVTARRCRYFDGLLLEEKPTSLPSGEEVTRVLAEAALARAGELLPKPDTPAGQYLTRLRCLRGWMPELELPEFSDAMLTELLPELCEGRKSLAELREADWLGAMQARLTHRQRQAVENEAPERLTVPTGSRLALTYEVGRPPVLAVRIQEIFGQRETPRIAGGRIKVLLHLLAPNYRPQQVTDDLSSFWINTYPLVRKDLRVRYPKHAWPDDPLSAAPQKKGRSTKD